MHNPFLVALLALSVTGSLNAQLYKWVDEDGITRYSDHLPADASKKAHDQLSSEGLLIQSKEAAMSADERTALEQEQRRQAILQQQYELAQQEQDRRDRVLLMTFSTERDILTTRDERLDVIDSVIKLLRSNAHSAEVQLEDLKKQAQPYRDRGEEIPGGLAQKIEFFSRKIESNLERIGDKLEERNEIEEKFAVDIARYRELKRQE